MKLTKNKEKEIRERIGNYFCDIILPVCQIAGYKVFTKIDLEGTKENTFSIGVNFPYRRIDLYIKQGGVEYYQQKDFDQIRLLLFHEAFHILHWEYKEYANARCISRDDLSEKEESLADHFSIIVDNLYQLKKK